MKATNDEHASPAIDVTAHRREASVLFPGECPKLCVGMTEKERHVYEDRD